MFGYIRPLKPELKIKEFEAYKSVYCGLCGQLGKSFGPIARFSLSYDFTFLSMLQYAVTTEKPEIARHRCYANPLRSCLMCASGSSLVFSADVAAIMIYFKLLDNLQDEGFLKKIGAALLWPLASRARKKAAQALPELDQFLLASMQKQKELEAACCDNIDAACAPSADAMAAIFSRLSNDTKQKRVLERLGYLIGRFVYMCDAMDDLEHDAKKRSYNPFLYRYGLQNQPNSDFRPVHAQAQESLYMTIGEIGKTADLLELNCFQSILQNIVHLGLRAVVDEILSKKEKSK